LRERDLEAGVPLGGSRVGAMSRTQVALRFQRAFPRFATSVGGGVGALGFEVPSTVSSDRFLTRLAFVRCRPDVAPCVRVHPELQPVCLSSRGRVVGPEPPVVITRSIRRAARSKAHLAAARPGATERLLQGFPKTAPPSTWPTGVHSRRQDRVASGLLPSAGRCHRPACSVLVVSHHLDGFLHRRPVGLLHPTADPGVHRVSAPRPPCKRASGLPRRCHTLQSLPHPYSRTRVTASRCPLVVSRLRPGATGSCATSRLCSVRAVRCDGPPLPAGQGPLLSWASRLGASRLSSHHGDRRPKPTDAARADPLGGPCVTCMRTLLGSVGRAVCR